MSVHKATLDDRYLDTPLCLYCGQAIKRVPGGHGPTWIHVESGAVAGTHEATNERVRARELVEGVLRGSDWVIPRLAHLITEDVLVPAEDADSDVLIEFMQRMNDLLHDIVDLRELSHRDHHHEVG